VHSRALGLLARLGSNDEATQQNVRHNPDYGGETAPEPGLKPLKYCWLPGQDSQDTIGQKLTRIGRLSGDHATFGRHGIDVFGDHTELTPAPSAFEPGLVLQDGRKTTDGLKKVQEITIAKILVQNLVEYCIGKQNEFI